MDRPLTIVMPYYENPGMLSQQYTGWAAWPEKLKQHVSIILVDDGSPKHPAAQVERPEGLPELSIYRVTEDRPWHQHAARNLGAHMAQNGWLLLTDMDHVIEEAAAARLVQKIRMNALDRRAVYMPQRIEADTRLPTLGKGGQPKPHPNSFVMTRATFWRIGGYDEDYCGIYGTDGLFRARVHENALVLRLKGIALTRWWRDLVPDASTNAPRKEGRDPDARRNVAVAKAERGEAGKVKVLAFDWERVV